MIGIGSNAENLLRRFARLPGEMQGAVKRGTARGLLLVEEEVKRRTDVHLSGGRSGLASRLTSYVEIGPGAIAIDGIIGFRKTRGFPYELAHEYGAKAKPGKAMAMPVSREARVLGQRGISARDFPRKLFRPKGTRVLAESMGRTTKIVVHYVFLKTIEPRLHFRESVTDNLDIVGREIVREVGEEL